MLSIIGSILTMIGPLAVFFIKLFIKNKVARAKAVKNYYAFIAAMDKKSTTKVEKHLAAESALEKLQREIREKELVEPERPTNLRQVKRYDVPVIIDVDVEVKTHGKYLTESGQAKGMVLHSTAGRSAAGKQDAVNTLNDLAKKGLGCLVMDIHGQIYKAKNQKLNEIAWHAGESAYLGHKGLSRYTFGMEVGNAGKIDADGLTWFGTTIPVKNRRLIATKRANQKAGTYHKFTAAQETAIRNFALWQLDVNPSFEIDFNIGHDECSPERKSDPGGSLSMTMPDFRAMIKKRIEEA